MTAMAGKAPCWQQAHATTATAMAMAGEAPRWRWTSAATTTETAIFRGRGVGGEGNCGGGGSGNNGGINGDDDNGGGNNNNDGSDDNDNSGSDNDNDGSDGNNNGGNRGDGGGDCDTATAVGIDKEDSNQLKVAMDNGRGRPRGGGRVLTASAHCFMQCPCELFLFCILQRMWLGNNAVCPEKFCFPQKELSPVFNLDSLVRMSDCCLQGIQPCKCKGKGCQWVGNQIFRLGSRKE